MRLQILKPCTHGMKSVRSEGGIEEFLPKENENCEGKSVQQRHL